MRPWSKQPRGIPKGIRIFVLSALLLTQLSFNGSGATTNEFHLVPPPFFHRIWQFEDGLPSPFVRAVTQNREGYLLIATDEGLAQFDGIRFREIEYKMTPGKPQRWLVGLLERKDGSIWASSVEGGILRSVNGDITRYTTNNSALPGNYVLSLYEDSKANLWVGTAAGLSRFTNGNFFNYTNAPGLIVEATRSILEDNRGSLWIGTAKGLSRFDGQTFTSFTTNDFLLNNAVYCLHQDRHGGLWIGTAGGLTHWLNGKIKHYTDKDGLAHNAIRVVREDSQGRLWVGTQGGLQWLKDNAFHFVKLQSVTDPGSKINSVVYSIFEDREQNLWVGTSLGLNQLRSQPVTVYARDEGLPAEIITAICQATNGTIWIATSGGGLCRLENDRLTTFTADDGLLSNHLLALHIDRHGTLWIGCDNAGLSRFKNGKFTNHSSDDPKANVIRVIASDRKDRLWLGSNAGLMRFREGRMRGAEYLPQNTVKAIVEDREGALWFAGDDSIVMNKDPGITHLRGKLGFTAHTANAVHASGDGSYYIGTDTGLFCFWNGQFHHIISHPELQHRRIFDVTEDDGENLWLSTQTGILSLPKRELLAHLAQPKLNFSLSSFGKQEGMRRAQCNGSGKPAAWKTQDGRIWFATINGVVVVDAKSFQHNTNPPPVHIEDVIVDGHSVALSSALTLPPGKGNIEFRYTALSLPSPEKVRFQYKLEGVDSDWMDAGNRRVARYVNVSPGNYRFSVKACNNDSVWNEAGASLLLTLQKHFYQTFWFGSLTAGFLASCVGLIVFGRIRAARNREMELQREVARHTEKLRKSLKTMESFNYSIAHDLRAPLRAIKGLTMALQEDYSSSFDSTGQDYSRRVAQAVDRMDSLIADLLTFGSISHKEIIFTTVDLDELLTTVMQDFSAEIASRNANIQIEHPLGNVWAHKTLLHQILLNLISNALKFIAPGVQPQLRIWTERTGSKIKIHVRDNGIGIAQEHHERIFGVFERLHATASYPGTGIGLAIVTKAVERMEGTVGLHSEVGKGSCFWIELSVPPNDQGVRKRPPTRFGKM